ncbi:MAG: prenyltransferase [Methanophagales archaeon ANME-1-THS]|nr:MAG: prenyltransferase [Methanophagales archaeon ANME-1-THS]
MHWNHASDILSGWIELSGLPKFTTTVFPFLLGSVVAWIDGSPFNGLVFLISLLAVFLLSSFCFVLNASSIYADLRRKGIDLRVEGTSALHSTAVSGRFNAFVKGRISVRQADIGAYLCVLAALPLGVLLQFYFKTGVLTLPLGLIGIFIAYSYSRGMRLSYHGLGEVALTTGVGWLTVFSGYYLQARQVSWLPTIVALPWVIDVFKLKLTRNIPDFECDQLINRRNLAVRMGKRVTASLYAPLTICAWLAFIPTLFLDLGVPYPFFVLLAIPIFFTARSVLLIQTFRKSLIKMGGSETKEQIRGITKNAFTGMILIPVALIAIFLLKIIVTAVSPF